MDDRVLGYYERELAYLREMGADFARRYPKIAGRLQLEPDKCEDPHTERLIDAFAFLCGRLREKIDDDFQDITEALEKQANQTVDKRKIEIEEPIRHVGEYKVPVRLSKNVTANINLVVEGEEGE